MQDFLLRRAVSNAGINFGQINVIVLKPPEMIQALGQGNIDAFIAWQPYPALAAGKEGAVVLLYSSDIWKDHPCCVLVGSAQFCRKHPVLVDKIKAVNDQA
jgi:NitT/TauT family transport system substrate-binding protein